jgi:hypothetical protein
MTRKGQILYGYQDVPLEGHRGMNKTYKAIKEKYTWPNMNKEIESCVKRCKSCQMNKILRSHGKVPMEITTTTHKPFEKCCLDILGPLTETENRLYFSILLHSFYTEYLFFCPSM